MRETWVSTCPIRWMSLGIRNILSSTPDYCIFGLHFDGSGVVHEYPQISVLLSLTQRLSSFTCGAAQWRSCWYIVKVWYLFNVYCSIWTCKVHTIGISQMCITVVAIVILLQIVSSTHNCSKQYMYMLRELWLFVHSLLGADISWSVYLWSGNQCLEGDGDPEVG